MPHAVHARRQDLVVSDHHHAGADLAVEGRDGLVDLFGGVAVEVAGGLVGTGPAIASGLARQVAHAR